MTILDAGLGLGFKHGVYEGINGFAELQQARSAAGLGDGGRSSLLAGEVEGVDATAVPWEDLRYVTVFGLRKRWVFLVGVSVVLLLLRRRRRLAREEAAKWKLELQDRERRQMASDADGQGRQGRRGETDKPASSLSRSAGSEGTVFSHPGMAKVTSVSGSYTWTSTGVDIGAVLGMDIGGTLSKLVYFEKKPPPRSQPPRQDAKDPMGEKLEMKRTLSLGSLLQTKEQQEALDNFYSFMEQASMMGESGVKDTHLSSYSHALGGVLHFFRFETRHMEHAVQIITNSRVHHSIQALGCTGGGAFKFEEFFMQRLGVEMLQMDEMACLVRGLQFALANVPGECYTYRPESEQKGKGSAKGEGKGSGGKEGIPDPQDTFRNMRMRQMSEMREKVDYSFKVNRSSEELLPTAYPALVVSIGSGVSILKVDGPSKFERVSGSSIGGGTYWGLCRLLTQAANYDQSLEMASRGDSNLIDMLVGDIYGRGYSKFQLSSNTLASSFGKVVSMENPRGKDDDPDSGVKEEDLAKALVVMITMNIGQVAHLNAKLYDTRRIYFVGNFLRHNHVSARRLAFAIDYWSSGEMEALFLEHEGYLGALGSFLMSGTEEPLAADQNLNSEAGHTGGGAGGHV